MPSVLDLFAGEGGAAMGYRQAGYSVVGIDLAPQRRYPAQFFQANALTLSVDFLRMFDLVHASPPCQFGTMMRHAPGAKGEAGHANLIPATRAMLEAAGVDYVIENVESDKVRPFMRGAVCLCGSMFGLGASSQGQRFHLTRHRLFQASFPIRPPCPCDHAKPIMGVYGGHVRIRAASHGGRGSRDLVGHDKPAMAREAMQMPWATMNGISEAIPPAYTRHIGLQHLALRPARRRRRPS